MADDSAIAKAPARPRRDAKDVKISSLRRRVAILEKRARDVDRLYLALFVLLVAPWVLWFVVAIALSIFGAIFRMFH